MLETEDQKSIIEDLLDEYTILGADELMSETEWSIDQISRFLQDDDEDEFCRFHYRQENFIHRTEDRDSVILYLLGVEHLTEEDYPLSQKEIRSITGWSDSLTSIVVSEMRENDEIGSFEYARENYLYIPEHPPEIVEVT